METLKKPRPPFKVTVVKSSPTSTRWSSKSSVVSDDGVQLLRPISSKDATRIVKKAGIYAENGKLTASYR